MENSREFSLVVTISTSRDDRVTRFYILVSGEHIPLAKAEVEALSTAFDLRFNWTGRIAEVVSKASPIEFLLDRAALVQEGGVILAEASSTDDVCSFISTDTLRDSLSQQLTFAVRTRCIGSACSNSSRNELETRLGSLIVKETGARVDLSNPDVTISVYLEANRVLVCRSVSSQLRRDLRLREPGKKGFFHPSMMNATLSRVMCNLSHIMPGDTVLDPFCGGGGILCEAAIIGARVVGSDVNWRLLRGAVTNLQLLSHDYSIVQGNAQNMPFSSCDAIVTDPPYGRASSTRGSLAIELVEKAIQEVPAILSRRGEHTCICGTQLMNLPQIVRDAGLQTGVHLEVPVHRGLVRDIVTIIT